MHTREPPPKRVSLSGVDADVHTGPEAAALAGSMSASAVTVGSNIYFGAGAWRPGTPDGERLLRHEIAHVAQSPPGVAPVRQIAPEHGPAEREAHGFAARGGAIAQRVPRGTALRHPVQTTTAIRHDESEILTGIPASPGVVGRGPMTLAEFDVWRRTQPDWFIGLSDTTRDKLWAMITYLGRGAHIAGGLGPFPLPDLFPRTGPELDALETYAFGVSPSPLHPTVAITRPTMVIAEAIRYGERMNTLEAQLGGASLHAAMPQGMSAAAAPPGTTASGFESYINDSVTTAAGSVTLWSVLQDYLTTFHPHLQAAGENDRLRQFLVSVASSSGGLGALRPLVGRIRNLHWYPLTFLMQQVASWTPPATPPATPVVLVLHSGHDWGQAFKQSDQVVLPAAATDPNIRLLVLEGQAHLTDISAEIPRIRATYGNIQDVVIVGHGESRLIEMAGTADPTHRPTDQGTYAAYPQEQLTLDGTHAGASIGVFDAILDNLSPGGRVMFAGCLVGTTQIPQVVPDGAGGWRPPTAAEITAMYSDRSRMSLGAWLRQRPNERATANPGDAALVARMLPFSAGTFVDAARADTGALNSWVDPATHRVAVNYPFDPTAFGDPLTYVDRGREPTGLMRSLRELMATGRQADALRVLDARLARAPIGSPSTTVTHGNTPNPAWDPVGEAMLRLARRAVFDNDLPRIHELCGVAGTTFMAIWNPIGVRQALLTLPAADRAALFPVLMGIGPAPPYTDLPHEATGIAVRQAEAATANPPPTGLAWLMNLISPGSGTALLATVDADTSAAAAGLITRLDATTLTLDALTRIVLSPWSFPQTATRMLPIPPPGAPTAGQIRLALLWAHGSPRRSTRPGPTDPVALQFLHGLCAGGSVPASVSAIAGTFDSNDTILAYLGLTPTPAPTGPPPRPGAAPLPPANARLGGATDTSNDALVDGPSGFGTVVAGGAQVWNRPGTYGAMVHTFPATTVVRVIGYVHEWAAVEFTDAATSTGRLGFVRKIRLSPRP